MATLRDLGLSEYEARVYRALLKLGPTTAKELSQTADVPMGRIYDVLNALEGDRLVRSQTASRPKKYVGVEPETGLDHLLEEKKAALTRQAEQYESIVDDLSGELDSQRPADEEFWTATVGPEESIDLLVERLAAATDSIVMVAGAPSPQFDIERVGQRVVDRLGDALGRDVDVSLLLATELVDSVPDAIWQAYDDRLVPNEAFHARVSDDIAGTFDIIDDVEVCLEVPNPLEPTQTVAMINLKNPEFATDLRSAFEARWNDADPVSPSR